MIPRRLQLTNFLSYRATAEVDFTGLHLACIAGMNGAGKSSILDAMTWALFGVSRSKSDDDVVNRAAAAGGEEAQVIFEFDLETVAYRIIRRKKAGKTMLVELQVAVDAAEGQWKALTGSKNRETDKAIVHLLGMNYTTFSNASFLLQGKADEFTTKTAGQRKDILADLLGMNQWDAYRDVVTEERKRTENELVLLDAQISDIETELLQEENRRRAWETAQAEYLRLKQEKETREVVLQQVRKTAELITQQKQQLHNLTQARQRAAQQLADWRTTHAKRQAELDSYQAILGRTADIERAVAAWQAAETAARTWQAKADQFNQLAQEKRPFELAVAEMRSQLAQQRQTLEKQALQVAQMRQEQSQLAPTLAQTQAQIGRLTADLEAMATAETAMHAARTALQALQNERTLWQQELGQLQKQSQEQDKLTAEAARLRRQQGETAAQLAQTQTRLADLTSQQAQLASLREEQSGLTAQKDVLAEAGQKTNERIEKLKAAEEEDTCPLCGQPLSAAHKQEVIAELEAEVASKRETYRYINKRLPEIEKSVADLGKALQERGVHEGQLQKLQQQVATAEARLAEIGRLQAEWGTQQGAERLAERTAQVAETGALTRQQQEVGRLEKQVQGQAGLAQQLQTSQRQLTQTEARLAEIERTVTHWESTGAGELSTVREQLSTELFALEARAQLAALDERTAAVGYDAAAHQAARVELTRWEKAPTELRELEKAQTAVQTLGDALQTLADQIATQQQEVSQRELEEKQAADLLASLTAEGESDVRVLEREVHRLREAEAEANRRVGMAWQQLAVLDDQRDRRAEKQGQRESVTLRIARLKQLERACGRDGVQGLLIERALPEIQERANALLDRLTDGRMRVEFDTQREAKSGQRKTIETLDIRIVDEVGMRPYENYSGGEQFRVNFAIRIALSQILSQRAGARLQTLVIDEGFGSQDPEGRQRLIEAIKTIQDDFRCILVITHITALQEAFPNQIEVYKSAAGSRIRVS